MQILNKKMTAGKAMANKDPDLILGIEGVEVKDRIRAEKKIFRDI